MMLGRTAGGLFWMFRYLERAENTARLLEAGWRMALTRGADGDNEWRSLLTTTGALSAYEAEHDEVDAAGVINFLLRSRSNSSSVIVSIEAARANARMVRTALSDEVWSAVNESWMALKAALARPVSERNLHPTLSAIRYRAGVVRGALHGTMLRNDIFAFARLGAFVERADSTARILDVKYYVLLPSAALVGSTMDNAQWETILRSVSAETSYRWVKGYETSPLGIAEFLILDQRMPRSLAFCYDNVMKHLGYLEADYGERKDSQALAGDIAGKFVGLKIGQVFEEGLHEFLTARIADTARLASVIETDYRFYR